MADATGPVVTALLAILNADTTVQSLCGRTSECAVAWGDFVLGREGDELPRLTFEDTGETDSDIENDKVVSGVLAAFACDADADHVAAQLLDAAEAAITNAALQAQGLNAGLDPTDMPWPRDRVEVTDQGFEYLVQRTMALSILITPSE
jgi:hypothetical protein